MLCVMTRVIIKGIFIMIYVLIVIKEVLLRCWYVVKVVN